MTRRTPSPPDGDDDDDVVANRYNAALLDKDSDEEELERFVLGSKETFREQLIPRRLPPRRHRGAGPSESGRRQ